MDPIHDLPEEKRTHLIIEEDEDYSGGGFYECPDCGMRYSFGGYFHADLWKYCPECGFRLGRKI